MIMKKLILITVGLFCFLKTQAQTVKVEGFVYETDNRGYIENAVITVKGNEAGAIRGTSKSDNEGHFELEVPMDENGYQIQVSHELFFSRTDTLFAKQKGETWSLFSKAELERRPGYIFDVTLAENNSSGVAVVDAIEGARIEIYNNTKRKEELVIKELPSPNFNFTFERGNYYTLLIRKKGYLNKRIEAFVNIDGCIMCFEGVNNITEVMTKGNEKGTFLGNVELDPIAINTTFQLKNIYYDYDKSFIRPDAAIELDKVLAVLKDNPAINVELGSHTDSRGRDAYNMSLSEARAASAVAYLVQNGISADRMTSRGYGESLLVNECSNGRKCSEESHQQNRRTELKITGIKKEDPLDKKTLKQLKEEEYMMEEIKNSEIKIEEGDLLPKELQELLKKQ